MSYIADVNQEKIVLISKATMDEPASPGMIELRPVIASYTGTAYHAIKEYLDSRILDQIVKVALEPVPRSTLDQAICCELIEMHVFKAVDDWVRLDTAVFLEEDFIQILPFASAFGRELAGRVTVVAAPLRSEPPVVVNFLVGIIGIVQSLGHALRKSGTGVEWWNYAGKYARSKVDFAQICAAASAAGPDFLNKTILKGDRYTAVFTGPGGESYLLQPPPAGSIGSFPGYVGQVNRFLTDAYACHLTGQLDAPALRAAAEQAGLLRDGVPETVVLTNDTVAKHLSTVQRVGQVVCDYYLDELGTIEDLLRSTRGGRQGVPAANMALHLWRYLRRAIAQELYRAGVFTDRVPETGLITIFYENDVEALNELFG